MHHHETSFTIASVLEYFAQKPFFRRIPYPERNREDCLELLFNVGLNTIVEYFKSNNKKTSQISRLVDF